MSFTPIPFESLQYLNPTQSSPPTINNDKCVLKTVPGTDWWHTTERDSQDGLTWGKWVEVGNGFEVKVKAKVEVTERVCLCNYTSQGLGLTFGSSTSYLHVGRGEPLTDVKRPSMPLSLLWTSFVDQSWGGI